MSTPIRICIDRQLPPDRLPQASRLAIQETAENLPSVTARALPGVYTPRPEELAVLTGKKWQTGRHLTVAFLDGAAPLRAKVLEVAKVWSDHATITFDVGNQSDAEIRISFTPGGSWSYIGTDTLAIPSAQQTKNFGWLTGSSSDDEASRVVLHEFGHALSAIHEHQSPAANIPWDTEAVYAFYGGPPNNWPREQIDRNIFEKYSASITNFSTFDPESIMSYAIASSEPTPPTPRRGQPAPPPSGGSRPLRGPARGSFAFRIGW